MTDTYRDCYSNVMKRQATVEEKECYKVVLPIRKHELFLKDIYNSELLDLFMPSEK